MILKRNCERDMKKEQTKKVRNRVVKMRMNDDEIALLHKFFNRSMERHLSNYLRKVSLQKPVIIKYRNQSADDFLKEMLALKKELNAIGNNFNQAVKKLHILDKIPEFRFWVNHYQAIQTELLAKVEQIKVRMTQLYEQWSQK